MRYHQLLESDQFDSPKEVIAFIKANCQPYLAENPTLKELYRGVNETDEVLIKDVRSDRRPRNTDDKLHDIINSSMDKAGFTALRNNSVFVTFDYGTAIEYGKLYIMFPIGKFDYTYSNTIVDLYGQADKIIEALPIKYINPKLVDDYEININNNDNVMWNLTYASNNKYGYRHEIFMHPDQVRVDWSKLPELLKKWYKTTDLDDASGEIMFHCDKVLLISDKYYQKYIKGKIL